VPHTAVLEVSDGPGPVPVRSAARRGPAARAPAGDHARWGPTSRLSCAALVLGRHPDVGAGQGQRHRRIHPYDYRDKGTTVLAAGKPSLHGALLAAKAAGHSHVIVDGTLIHADRISIPGPTPGVDLWWSGKHRQHGGNIQVV
jgi:hypothetical protein